MKENLRQAMAKHISLGKKTKKAIIVTKIHSYNNRAQNMNPNWTQR